MEKHINKNLQNAQKFGMRNARHLGDMDRWKSKSITIRIFKMPKKSGWEMLDRGVQKNFNWRRCRSGLRSGTTLVTHIKGRPITDNAFDRQNHCTLRDYPKTKFSASSINIITADLGQNNQKQPKCLNYQPILISISRQGTSPQYH